MSRRRDFLFEKTMRDRDAVAGPAIGPGPAAVFGFARIGAGFALGIHRRFEGAVIAAIAINGKLKLAHFGLDDAGTTYARDAAARLLGRHDLALEPAHRRAARGGRIGEAPGPAAALAVATGGADGGIAVRNGGAAKITPRPVIT